MREIKFRVYDKERKLMTHLKIGDRNPQISRFHVALLSDYVREDWGEVMQFIGLKDKNGTDIYEGDVIRFWHLGEIIGEKIGEVGYSNSHACFYIRTKNKYGVKIAILDALSWYYEEGDVEETRVEIIGNIYKLEEGM